MVDTDFGPEFRFWHEIEEHMTLRYFGKHGGVIHVVFGIGHSVTLESDVYGLFACPVKGTAPTRDANVVWQ
jgi:hypothetical protein